jgi:hypothetical protein
LKVESWNGRLVLKHYGFKNVFEVGYEVVVILSGRLLVKSRMHQLRAYAFCNLSGAQEVGGAGAEGAIGKSLIY